MNGRSLRLLLDLREPVLLDGGMGTELASRGVEMGGQSCLSCPAAVLSIHEGYLSAGSRALTTNTLTMNAISMRAHRIALSVREVNIAGARLARKAAGPETPVLGNLSSSGELLEPYGNATERELEEVFREQAAALRDGGVDGFILETYSALPEALCGLRACLDVAGLPVIVTMSFATVERGGRTVMGDRADSCAQALAEAGASAVGANCGGLDPRETAEIVSAMRAVVRIPIVAQPNAGKARLERGRTVFGLEPEQFALGMQACLDAGARLVGGCCGTTPAHIRALASRLGGGP